jgi:hypothetical protein
LSGLVQRLEQAAGDVLRGPLVAAIREQDRELVAPEPGDGVLGADAPLETLGGRCQ